jgi:hypothetical protein
MTNRLTTREPLATSPHELTWTDIQREALQCPILQRLVRIEAMNTLPPVTREQLMIWALLWLSRNRREMLDRETGRLMREPRYCTCAANGIELPTAHATDCRMRKGCK